MQRYIRFLLYWCTNLPSWKDHCTTVVWVSVALHCRLPPSLPPSSPLKILWCPFPPGITTRLVLTPFRVRSAGRRALLPPSLASPELERGALEMGRAPSTLVLTLSFLHNRELRSFMSYYEVTLPGGQQVESISCSFEPAIPVRESRLEISILVNFSFSEMMIVS